MNNYIKMPIPSSQQDLEEIKVLAYADDVTWSTNRHLLISIKCDTVSIVKSINYWLNLGSLSGFIPGTPVSTVTI